MKKKSDTHLFSRRRFIQNLSIGGASLALGLSCAKKGHDLGSIQHPTNRGDGGDLGAGDSGAGDLGAPVAPSPLVAPIGLQLYTVRALMEADVAQTLRQVAQIGYTRLEFAGYFGHAPDEVRQMLADLNMTAPSAHFSFEELQGSRDAVIDTAVTVGHEHIVLAWLPEAQRTREGYLETAELLSTTAASAAARGLRVAYHHHDFDFSPIDDTTGLDLLMSETDPDLVDFELDLYWALYAGVDVTTYLGRHPGRFKLGHLKDIGADKEMLDVGSGAIDWPATIAQLKAAGCEHFFVEHDNPSDPLTSITNSYNFISTGG